MLFSNLSELAQAVGYLGLFSIVFVESGVFVGFFLPGDSLLFTVGLLASLGYFNIWILIPLLTLAAVLGDNVGYAFGKYAGPKLFTKNGSFWFNPNHLTRTKHFFETHGAKAVVLARFIPIVRTFTPILAGAGKMKYTLFLTYNILGGVLWAVGITLLGYFLGNAIPNIDTYLLPIILGIICVSFIPVIRELLRKK